jgi:hypothetical protein
MQKKIEDYLHLYLGCELKSGNGGSVKLFAVTKEIIPCTDFGIAVLNGNQTYTTQLGSYRPVLRPLSDMTEKERADIFEIIFGRPFKGRTEWFKERTTLQEPRWVLSQSVDRVGIQMNGEVWADCDLHPFKMNPHETSRYLLSKGFDLFGLIDAGLATDKIKV